MADPIVVECASACTVTHVVQLGDVATMTAEQVGDYMALWSLFLVAAVVILGAKAIYKRFRIDYEH